VISAAMLGAICGSGALPFAVEQYVEAIRSSGIEAESSTRTFDAAGRAAATRADAGLPAASSAAAETPMEASPARPSLPAGLEERSRPNRSAAEAQFAREGA